MNETKQRARGFGGRWRLVMVAAALAALSAGAAFAQAAAGALQGRVLNEEGGGLAGVRVTVSNPTTGLSRAVTTGADGGYLFASLPAGTYTLRAELEAFSVVNAEGVVVHVATTRTQDLVLKPAEVEETITVTGDAPLVATSPSIGTVVSQSELENLPLNGRQFANLGTLAPGTTLGVNPDPTKPNQLVIALNGGIGRNVNYVTDGGDNMDDTIGGALQNFNLEAVQEFTIQTQQYKAEFGRSTGGVLSVVTKTGTNELAGSVYGYFRDKSLNSKTESEKRAGRDKGDYERQQYGVAIGGPFVRDRAHYFATVERTDRDTSFVVNSRGIFPELDGRAFGLPFEDTLVTAKATWDPGNSQLFQARLGFQETRGEKYSASPLSTPSNLGTINSDYKSILFGHSAQVGGSSFNELVLQYSDFFNEIAADSTAPLRVWANGVSDGQNGNTPQTTFQEKWQLKDDFSFTREIAGSRHDFKTGFNYIHEPELGGGFSAGTTGQFFYLNNDPNGPIRQISFTAGDFQFSTPVDQYSIYFQDDWRLSPNFTLNVGLRYDYWDGFDLDQRANPIWQRLSTQTTYNEKYLRDFQGGKGGVLSNDDDNWGPRVGFTWDLRGDGRRIVRGGWGIYYDFPYTNATILFPSAAVQSDYGVAYLHVNPTGIRNADGSLYRFGQPLPPNQLPAATRNPPNEVASPTLAAPRSEQLSLGYSMQPTDWLGLNFELVKIEYRDIPFRFRANPIDPATGARRFPQFGSFRIWSGDGEADYEGANIGFRIRADRLEVQGFYTYSEATGNILAGTDEFRITAAGHQPDLGAVGDQSVNPLDPNCGACFGPLNTDAKNRFTVSAVYRGPWDLVMAGIFRYRSGFPYTEWTGVDANRDSYAFELPAGVSNVNNRRGDSFSQLDLRLSRAFQFGAGPELEVIFEVFNLFNEENPARFIGNRSANNFGQPTVFAGDPLQGEQRLGQIGLRLRF